MHLPFRTFEPTFYSGLLDDPVLLLHVRPLGRSLLFDCGQIHHLAKRVVKSVDAIFISHPHMDHFMGLDSFIRQVHVSPRTIEIFGPAGIARKTAAKLSAYAWNLTETFWCTFLVHEILPDRLQTYRLSGPEGFPLTFEDECQREGRVILKTRHFCVEAEECDHQIPSLMYRVTEPESFLVSAERIEREGYIPGDWLRELKKWFYRGAWPESIAVPLRGNEGEVMMRELSSAEVYAAIKAERKPASVGYVTDIGFTQNNIERIVGLLEGVTLLVCECTFLAAEREKARTSHHLCTDDLNRLLERLRPTFVLPMHLSKSYLSDTSRLYKEIEPPPGVTVLRIPDYVTPRPLIPAEVPAPTQ